MTVHGPPTRRTLLANVAALGSGSALAQGLTAAALLLTARQLGVSRYGQYASTFALLALLSVCFNLGLDNWLLRAGGRQRERLPQAVGSALLLKGGLGALWLIGVVALLPLLAGSAFPRTITLLAALVIWCDALLMTLLSAFKIVLQARLAALLESGSDALLLLGTLGLMAGGAQRAESFLALRVAALLPALLLGLWWLRQRVGVARGALRPTLRESRPYALSELLALAGMRADVVLVKVLLGDGPAGLYASAVSVVTMLFFVPNAIFGIMVPVLSDLFAHHPAQGRATARRTTLLFAGVGLAMMAALALLADPIVLLLGADYTAASTLMRILALLLLFKALSFGMAAILVAGGWQGRRTAVQALAVASNVLLNLALVPRLGVAGAAWVFVLSEIVLCGGYAALVALYRKRSSDVPPALLGAGQ